jgi:glycine cleavage system protein P-like pyridoxal-binding family
MALSVIQRPQGHVLPASTSGFVTTYTVSNSGGDALFTNASPHGLSSGNYLFIYGNKSAYNGYWYVQVIGANTIKIRSYATAANELYIADATVTAYSNLYTHGWSCVHLPIVYELSNTRWPVNSVDTARTISSISDDNGYVNLNLSGSLGTFEDLSFIKISNASDSS